MQNLFEEFIFNFFAWTIIAGICLGFICIAVGWAIYGAKRLFNFYRKGVRLREFKSHFPQRVK